ncbi:S26 family signal peptidase [Pirellulaceae bacterium SH449]
MIFLALSICMAAILLMRRGMKPLYAGISGSSMEPHLVGPRFLYKNTQSGLLSSFAIDSLRPNQPLDCQFTGTRDNDFDFLEALAQPGAITPGETVRYYLWKRMAALRSAERKRLSLPIDSRNSYQGIVRGDLIVIQPPDDDAREVKRIVGFPGETIDIENGDLRINDERWKRDWNQVLEHSILLDYGDRLADSKLKFGGWLQDTDTHEFRTRSGGLITNELRWNAHDSHTLVPVCDVGVALELTDLLSDWQIAITLRTTESWTVLIECTGSKLIVSTATNETTVAFAEDLASLWLVVMMVDGEGVVGTSNEEWMRELIPVNAAHDEGSSLESDTVPLSIQLQHGDASILRWLVFRDIYHRGAGDSSRQSLQAGDGIVVLGDNVSISDDSRQRWEGGLSTESIRGVLDLEHQGWEALWKQRVSTTAANSELDTIRN